MKCDDVLHELSAYVDAELEPSRGREIEAHIADCSACARQLAQYRSLSQAARDLPDPQPPDRLWRAIEAQVESSGESGAIDSVNEVLLDDSTAPTAAWSHVARRLIAVAAVVALVLGAGYGLWDRSPGGVADGSAGDRLRVVFSEYARLLPVDPQAAKQVLHTAFRGKPLAGVSHVGVLDPRLSLARGLPDGYRIETISVVKMPCCTCVEAICRRSDGTVLSVFEHVSDDLFDRSNDGDVRKSATCRCDDSCCLAQLDDSCAATERCGDCVLTFVGVKNSSELDRLVAWFDRPAQRN